MTHSHSVRMHLVCPVTVLGTLLLGLAMASATLASPVPIDTEPPRPTLTPAALPPQDPVPAPQPEVAEASPPILGGPCESICGRVLNLASSGGEPDVTVRFAGAGWAIDAQSDTAGDYGYGRLGQDIGFISIAPSGDEDLHPVTQNIALSVPPGQAIVVNLGANRGTDAGQPLIVPRLSVTPSSARQGEQVVFTVEVRNTLGGTMSRIWITDLLPAGLSLSGVATDRGEIVRSGDYAAVNVAGLTPGENVTVSIYADVDADAPQGTIRNQVSLIYAEHAAAQSSVDLRISTPATAPDRAASDGQAIPSGAGGPDPAEPVVTLPVTGLGHQMAGAAGGLLLMLFVVRRMRLHRTH